MAYLAGVQGHAFAYGDLDCLLFGVRGVEAMTGADLTSEWAGQYASLRAAKKMLKDRGFKSHVDALAERFEEVPPAFAMPGDLAVMPGTGAGKSVGIFQGDLIWALGEEGIGFVPRTVAERAFRV